MRQTTNAKNDRIGVTWKGWLMPRFYAKPRERRFLLDSQYGRALRWHHDKHTSKIASSPARSGSVERPPWPRT